MRQPVITSTLTSSYRTIRDLEEKARRLENEIVSLQRLQEQIPATSRRESQDSQSSDILGRSVSFDRGLWDEAALNPHNLTTSEGLLSDFNFIGHGTALDLCLKTATLAGQDTLDAILFHSTPVKPSSRGMTLLKTERLERSTVEPSLIRGLIKGHYFPVLHQIYPVVEPSQLDFSVRLKQLSSRKRLLIVLTAAVAAAYHGRHDQSMQVTALVLRQWADDMLSDVLASQDDASVQVMMLLIFYELVDPRRRLAWHLLGMTCRMCLRLRWHREEDSVLSTVEQDLADHLSRFPSPLRRQLFRIVYQWER